MQSDFLRISPLARPSGVVRLVDEDFDGAYDDIPVKAIAAA
jgi:hypothetical protein